MKIYVASKFENTDEVRRAYELLRAKGHEITHDWTAPPEGWEKKEGQERSDFICAIADAEGVWKSDILILLCRPNMKGAFIEVGIAIGLRMADCKCGLAPQLHGKPAPGIITVGAGPESENAFFHFKFLRHFKTIEEAIAWLDTEEAQGEPWVASI